MIDKTYHELSCTSLSQSPKELFIINKKFSHMECNFSDLSLTLSLVWMYLSKYLSLFLAKAIFMKYAFINKGFIIFVCVTQWSSALHIKSSSMQGPNVMVNCKLLFEMFVFTKVLSETEQEGERSCFTPIHTCPKHLLANTALWDGYFQEWVCHTWSIDRFISSCPSS